MQFTTLIIAFVALVVSAFASPVLLEREIRTCGSQNYDTSQYTCYLTPSPPLLCPILGGVIYQRCGPACYKPADYACRNGQLVPVTTCADVPFDHNSYVCNNDTYLCPKAAPNSCGIACYSLSMYHCVNGVLVQN